MNKVILYVATSTDSFIADKNGGVDWLPSSPDENDTVGFKILLNRISTIIMGSKSYQQILGFGDWAWPDKTTYVFTKQPLTTSQHTIFFISEDPKTFIANIHKTNPNQDIWLLGGAELIKSFAKEQLIDECIITIVPVTLGEGIKLELPYNDFNLIETKSCVDGIIQKIFIRK